ncbi:hypothetical protein GALMADRAFT_250164 [Galerina marginata CBS 339.88]|uniref:Uncharacterized protein n=1 Tax=Galerina marginata (strain CBS 339.88) TaxID=685588 RepID=A0A067STR0_GALM3|nr:hypothetical protein GALMADRAFT_250164 [Galerina marginata CBS 339.88]
MRSSTVTTPEEVRPVWRHAEAQRAPPVGNRSLQNVWEDNNIEHMSGERRTLRRRMVPRIYEGRNRKQGFFLSKNWRCRVRWSREGRSNSKHGPSEGLKEAKWTLGLLPGCFALPAPPPESRVLDYVIPFPPIKSDFGSEGYTGDWAIIEVGPRAMSPILVPATQELNSSYESPKLQCPFLRLCS